MAFTSQQQNSLLHTAELLSEEIRKDPSVLAVILSGPLALGRPSESDRLYIVVITDKDDGIIEHHFLDDGWHEITHPIEMGRFPLTVATFLVTHGYSDMVSYKSLEAFRCGKVLWEKDSVGTDLIEATKQHIPAAAFIGESLHGAVSALDDAVALYKNNDYQNAVLMARDAAVKAVEMVIREHVPEGEVSLLEAAQEYLTPENYRQFLQIMNIADIDEDDVTEIAQSAKEFASYTLRQIGVNPEQVLGNGKKER